MANQSCYTPLQVCALRVAKLDAQGNGLPGASNGYAADSLIEATLGIEIEEGDEITKKNGCGELCVTFKDVDRIKRATIDLNLCTLDAELMSLLVGGSLIRVSGTTSTGYKVPKFDDTAPDGVCLELWSKAWDGAEQAQPAALGSVNAYYHFVIPKAKFTVGDLNLANDASEIPLTGFGEENSALNIDGPYNDWPTEVGTAGGFDSTLGWFLDDALPTTQCGFITVPSQGS